MRLNNPYLTDQLIPYIGNKRKLLPLIHEAINATGLADGTFFDVFAGSGVVSRLAKTMGFRVIANDWEPYAEKINQAYIATNITPEFICFGGIEKAVAALNALEGVRGYIASRYCPSDDEAYDTETERMFYTQQNGRRIDAIREQILEWRNAGKLNGREEALLLASLIYQASYCSNTSGVFKGFHRGWGGATKTAWYRIRSVLTLSAPILFNNNLENEVLREDASLVAKKVECDIAYLDPPYNQHQYGSNYHLLNTVALWDKPAIPELISNDGRRDKAAIRMDWRTERRSAYCYKSEATSEFTGLIGRLNANWILVSYSTEGIIPVEDLLSILGERGELSVVVKNYKRYRVSSQRPSPKQHTTEFVAIVNTQAETRPSQVADAVMKVVESGLIVR